MAGGGEKERERRRGTKYAPGTPSHVLLGQKEEEGEPRGARKWKEKGKKNNGERGSAVITSAALNGGISQYLWHNFMGFTMAYIRGPAERISPWGTHRVRLPNKFLFQ